MRPRPAALLAVLLFSVHLVAAAPVAVAVADVVVSGGGWGHGVGMSQYGAYGQALAGSDSTEIVQYYYSGASVRRWQDLSLGDSHLFTGEDPLWVALPGLQAVSRVDFRGVGGPVALCQDGDGEGACPKDSARPQAGEGWSLRVVAGGCRFFRGDTPVGNPGSCRVALSFDEGAGHRIEVGGRQYAHGEIKIRPVPGADSFHVVLALGLEEYVYGLAEMAPSWHLEALETQALAGRSYAAYRFYQYESPGLRTTADAGLSTSRQSQCWCHLYATTIDQAYNGWSYESGADWSRWKTAADATAGRVVHHPTTVNTQGGIAQAFYSSSTGGATENSEDKWVTVVPFLRSRPDPWSQHPRNPYGSWARTYTPSQLASAMSFQSITSARIEDTYQSGSPAVIRVEGQRNGQNTHQDYTGAQFAAQLGLRSHYVWTIGDEAAPAPPPEPPPATCNGLAATIIGTAGDDVLAGTPGDDVIHGKAGNDRIRGLGGDDVLCGGPGDDVLIGDQGDDFYHGGEGRDMASFIHAGQGVVVDLGARRATGDGTDVLVHIEDVAGTTHDDRLFGDSGPNLLIGLGGADELRGRAGPDHLRAGGGDDRLDGGTGDDLLDGGGGRDTASYVSAPAAVQVWLDGGRSAGGAGDDTLTRIRDVLGSLFADHLVGDGRGNRLRGLGGNDDLDGKGGRDDLRGAAGEDRANGGPDDDRCRAEEAARCER